MRRYLILLVILLIMGCTTEINCDRLERQTKELIEKANYCDIDSDCIISPISRCPFGCHLLFNKNADISKIEENLKLFNYNCMECKYDCDIAPNQDEIKCINNKCVDMRYS